MKNFFLIALLAVTGVASAEWVQISENEEANVYIDLSTLHKDGNLRTVWQLHDQKKRGEDGVMSTRISWEYDCQSERVRILSATSHPEAMAKGKKLFTVYKASDWRDIAPNTMGYNGLKAVCAQ